MPPLPDAAARPTVGRSARRELWTGLDHSFVMGLEMVSAILLYGGIGFLADRWLGTGPWLMAIGALLGNAAGLYLLWLRSERMNRAEEAWRAARDAR